MVSLPGSYRLTVMLSGTRHDSLTIRWYEPEGKPWIRSQVGQFLFWVWKKWRLPTVDLLFHGLSAQTVDPRFMQHRVRCHKLKGQDTITKRDCNQPRKAMLRIHIYGYGLSVLPLESGLYVDWIYIDPVRTLIAFVWKWIVSGLSQSTSGRWIEVDWYGLGCN